MKRGPIGVAGLQKKNQSQQSYRDKGSEIQSASLEQLKEVLPRFKANLEEFAKKYKKEINANPEFRKYFSEMCSKIGVDPLASNKGFWAEMLGVGDFYYELAVQIIEVCLKTRSRNGGLIAVDELRSHLEKMRGKKSQAISNDDIERAVRKVKILGAGFQLISVGSHTMVQSVPCELNIDHTTVLVLAQENKFVTSIMLEKDLKWTKDRIRSVLDLLVRESMAWIDDQSETGQRAYWFPSMMGGSLSDN